MIQTIIHTTGYFEGAPGAQVPLPVARLRNRKSVKLMGPEIQSLLAAALAATDQAGWTDPVDTMDARCGICVAAPTPTFPASPSHFEGAAAPAILKEWPPLWLLGCLWNMAASHMAIQFQASGPCHTLATNQWKSLISLAESLIEEDEADRIIVAGRTGDGVIRAALVQKMNPGSAPPTQSNGAVP
jgi:3-oxoacyl-(acyl-carrier-protein) synthase